MTPPERPDSQSEEDEPIFELEIEDALDLHTFAPRDILTAVEGYLEAAHEKGFPEVRLIHGKGTGFQRDRVQKYLSSHPLVAEFWDAPVGQGHWGATIARFVGPESASAPDKTSPDSGTPDAAGV